jgi:hypothetical protein
MHKFTFRSISLLTLSLCLSASSFAQSRPFISFDAPDSFRATFPSQINASGQIVGYYTPLNPGNQGFVRSPNGTITEFSAPNLTFTTAAAINNLGQIVGYGEINVPPSTNRGFLRSAGGSFVQIMYPGSRNTQAFSINDSGVIVGYYDLASGPWHGYVRDASGNYTAFDAPGAGSGFNQGTFPIAVNGSGQIAGYYQDSAFSDHGFVRDVLGNLATFDVPGSTQTVVLGFNNNGDATGYSVISNTATGFIRQADGTFITFSAPGATTTQAISINDNGYVCGTAISATGVSTGFLRDPSGNLSKVSGPQPNNGGSCSGINNSLHTTGSYVDSSEIFHGWVR